MAKNKTNNISYVVFLSFVAALGGILFGYDTAVISGTTSDVAAQFGLSDISKGWYVGCALIGSIIGVACAGMLSDFIGRKKTMLIAAVLFSVSAIGCCLCAGFNDLVAYRIIGGVGIGIVSIVSPIYISEVSPASIRGTMVSLYQLAVTMGLCLAYLINYVILANSADISAGGWFHKVLSSEMWRGMLGSETFVAVAFFIIIFFIPESPRWLMVKNRDAEAIKIFHRLMNGEENAMAEYRLTKGAISSEVKSQWSELRHPGIIKAVLIGSAIAILGQFMGVNAVLYYGPDIFADAGLAARDSSLSTVLVGLVNMLTTVLAVFVIDKLGRKKLIYYGVSSMIICLVAIGCIFATKASGTLLLIFFMLYIFSQAISISAVVFVLLSEMYPNKVRGIAMSIAGLALWTGTYLIGQFTPWCMSTLTPAGTFFFFAAMCIPYMLIIWKLVPETTGKTLEEIEKYWKK